MELTEKTVRREELLNGRVLKMHIDEVELPDGSRASRECVDHPGGVCVAALTDRDELLFVRQFRYPYAEVVTELPAGKLDFPDEDPLEAACRELREETGAIAGRMIPLGQLFPSPAILDEVIHLYLATDLQFAENDPDEDEYVDVVTIPLETLTRQILDGEIPDAKTQTAVLKLLALRRQNL